MNSARRFDEGEIHDILRNDRRRAVITVLDERGGSATIRELSERIATLESNEDPPPRNLRQSVYVSLHQTHLPKLDALDIVDYDTDTKRVELREESADVKAHMGSPEPDRWPFQLVIGVSVLGSVFSVAVLAGFDTVLAAGAIVSFGTLIAVGAYALWGP
ncbi:DUF7344 domain-containing protein [Natronorarus salvus]|uniref:DUF7344 domain-containing protein n=1 Tax=Natronorarus salvus TaxID=3117733 RepID=UPI002F266743